MIIYKATFPDNKCYIGQTSQKLKIRKRAHIYAAYHCSILKNKNNGIIKSSPLELRGKNTRNTQGWSIKEII